MFIYENLQLLNPAYYHINASYRGIIQQILYTSLQEEKSGAVGRCMQWKEEFYFPG